MANIETILELMTEHDNEYLLHLEDIKCQDFDNGREFTFAFHFKDNTCFTKRAPTKCCKVPSILLDDKQILKNIQGCKID